LAKSGYWPQVSASVDVQYSKFVSSRGFATSGQLRYGPSISLSYLLWDFGARSGALHQSEFQLAGQRLTRNQTLQDVILRVEQTYYLVLGQEALERANRKSLKEAKTNLDVARQRKAHGLATVGDVYQAQAAASGARLVLQQTRGQLAIDRGQLATAVGYAADTKIPLQPLPRQIKIKPPSESVKELLSAARQSRPELLAAKSQEQAAAANVTAVAGQYLPSFNFNANAGRTYFASQPVASQYSARVSVSIPLFTGFAATAAKRRARANQFASEASTQQLLRQVELEVWQAYQNVQTASETVNSSKAQLKSAQLAAKVVQARYRNGLDTILDVLTAQSTLATARVQRVQADLSWFSALAALGHAVGGLGAPPGLGSGSP
jgi:outer membrane protein TolC